MATDLKPPAGIQSDPDGSDQRLLAPVEERRQLAEPPPTRRAKGHPGLVALALIALLGYGGYRWIEKKKADEAAAEAKKKAQPPPRVPVVAVAARKMDMPVYLTGLGSVTAYNTVTVKTRVDGQIVQIFFNEGDTVKQGEALIEIDPRPYQVQLLQAEGQLARDQSQLTNAKADLDRYQSLSDKGIIARQQRDTQASLVGQYEGGIKADEAAIENAKLQLTYCHITAPIGGRIGLRLVDIGNIAHASDATGLLGVLKRFRDGVRLLHPRFATGHLAPKQLC